VRWLRRLMMGSFAVGMALMLLFDTTLTRVAGMLALSAFIVAGVFVVADPGGLLAGEEDRQSTGTSDAAASSRDS
jgi:hypothetical protein